MILVKNKEKWSLCHLHKQEDKTFLVEIEQFDSPDALRAAVEQAITGALEVKPVENMPTIQTGQAEDEKSVEEPKPWKHIPAAEVEKKDEF